MRNLDNHSLDQFAPPAGNATDSGPTAHHLLPRRKILLRKESITTTKDRPLASQTPISRSEESQVLLDKVRLQLHSTLQSSLEPHKILGSYFQQITALVDICGFNVNEHTAGATHLFGDTALHTLTYQLDTGKQAVGEITYYSRSRINGFKLELLELATSTLIFPLQNAQLYQQALAQADTDPLTGLANRRSLENQLPTLVASARRFLRPLSLLLLDLDHFKRINDTFGHPVGDQILQIVGEVFSSSARASDWVFRYGGEEFVCVLDGTDREGAAVISQRLCEAVNQINLQEKIGLEHCPISISIGFAEIRPGEPVTALLQRADTALYRAKARGRNCFAPS